MDIRKSKSYCAVRDSLTNALLKKYSEIPEYYEDMVNKYMDFWVTNQRLQNDIDERGVAIEYNNGGGQTGWKKNDSVDQQIKVNAQMLKILSCLSIDDIPQEGDAECDL